MLITRVAPDRVHIIWDKVRLGILRSVPPMAEVGERGLQYAISEILAGRMQLWATTDENDLVSMAITRIEKDPLVHSKFLTIYSMFNFRPIPKEMWERMLEVAVNFAKDNDCKKIVAIVSDSRLAELGEQYGFSGGYTIIQRSV